MINLRSPSKLTSCCIAAPPESPSDLPNGALWPRSSPGSVNRPDAKGKGSPAGLKIVSTLPSYDMVVAFFSGEGRRGGKIKGSCFVVELHESETIACQSD